MDDFLGLFVVLIVAGLVAMAAAVIFWVTVIVVGLISLFVIACNIYVYFEQRKTEQSKPKA